MIFQSKKKGMGKYLTKIWRISNNKEMRKRFVRLYLPIFFRYAKAFSVCRDSLLTWIQQSTVPFFNIFESPGDHHYACSKVGPFFRIDRFPNYCLGTSNGAWPVAEGRAIASFPYFPYGRVEKRQWEDGQEGEERRLWQSERLVECFLTKGIFEAAKTSHQRKQILLGVERKLSVAQSLRCYGIVTKLIGLFPLFFQVKVYVSFSCVCQHCKKQRL